MRLFSRYIFWISSVGIQSQASVSLLLSKPFEALLRKFELNSIATVHHLPVENLLLSLKAALKPGGSLVILDLLEHENVQDVLSDFVAVPLNWLLQTLRNRHIQPSSEAVEAMREHLRTDKYFTLSQARRIYTSFLGKAKVRKHLFWRYSVVWKKGNLRQVSSAIM